MKIAITGAAGFIGSHVADAYAALGHELLVIDNLSTGRREQVPATARFVEADLRSEAAASAVESFRPDVLNLHAAQIDVRRSVVEARFDADVNLGGTLNVLEAARRGGALARVIYAASGGSMYGDSRVLPTPETEPPAAVSPYGVSKAAAEQYLSCYRALYGLHYVALRYANVYGPRQNAHGEAGVVAIFIERVLQGKDCTVYGDGGQSRDFVHVHDVVDANVRALTCDYAGGVNVATGAETDVNRIYALIARAVGLERPARFEPARAGEQRRSVLDNRKAKQVLGWEPAFGVERGIEQTVRWFQARR